MTKSRQNWSHWSEKTSSRTINMRIFMEKTQGDYLTEVIKKMIEADMPDHDQ